MEFGEVMLTAAQEFRAHGDSQAARDILDQALRWFKTRPAGRDRDPDYRSAMGVTLYEAQHWLEAERLFAAFAREYPDDISYQGNLGRIAAQRGDRETALRVSEWLRHLNRPYLFGLHTLFRARIAATLKEGDNAVTLLGEAFAQGQENGVWLHRDPDFTLLRDYLPFQALLRPKG